MKKFLIPTLLSFCLCATLIFAQEEIPVAEAERPVLRAQVIQDEPVDGEATSSDAAALPQAPAAPTTEAVPLETVSPPSPLDAQPVGDDAVRLQIFLDESRFGPGVIDGKPGRFTQLAVRSWNEVNGHPLEDWIAVNTAAREAVKNPFATAIVPEIAKQWVNGKLPTKRELQAKVKRMSYRSYAEFMSERYHTDVPYLIVLNGKSKVYNLKPRDTLVVPNVSPFVIEQLTGARHLEDPALSTRLIVVDTKNNQARIFESAPTALIVEDPDAPAATASTQRANKALIASFPITPGKPQFIRYGIWELRNMIELPHWRFDKKLLETGKRGDVSLNIPPGPNSPVGVIWNGTSRSGIGLHGTSDPETIGRARSAGCIRLANWDAVRLPELIRPGATVEIR
ncbi:MAG: L,D-transpeptidase [Verrucomicrobia bacterium]|nr:MAG: L,D-transpeptidase [Verrucomicrobiota bacterium]